MHNKKPSKLDKNKSLEIQNKYFFDCILKDDRVYVLEMYRLDIII